MAFPTITVTQGTGTTVNTLPNAGQQNSAGSLPVVVASDQSALPANVTQVGGSNLALSNGGVPVDAAGTKVSAATIPTGGVGFLGWLSAIWYQLTQTITAQLATGSNTVGNVTRTDPAATTGSITAADTGSAVAAANAYGQVIVTGTATANSAVACTASGQSMVAVQLVSASGAAFVGTVVFEKSIDGGTTWRQFSLSVPGAVSPVGSIAWATAQTIVGRVNVAAGTRVRVRCTAYTSGTLAVTFQPGYGVEDVTVPGGLMAAAFQGTLTDRSGTITTGSTSQQVAAANSSRKYFLIANPATNSVPIYVNFTSAASSSGNSLYIAPGGSFVMEAGFITTEAVNVIAATTGLAFTAKEGQ